MSNNRLKIFQKIKGKLGKMRDKTKEEKGNLSLNKQFSIDLCT